MKNMGQSDFISRILFACCVYVIIFFCSCMEQKKMELQDTQDIEKLIREDFPLLDGSTSTLPLQVKLACDIFGVKYKWTSEKQHGVQRTIILDMSKPVPDKARATIDEIKHNMTHDAYVNIIEGKASLALIARLPSPDEIELAQSARVELDMTPVALDAFVFLAHVDNPVKSLTMDQVRSVYSGRIRTWGELGVKIETDARGGEQLVAYQRERNSGSQELLVSLVMKDLPVIDGSSLIVQKMTGPFNAIGGDALGAEKGNVAGFCYSVFYYTEFMFYNKNVKMIAIDGVTPSSKSIARREYPIVADVYLVTRKDLPPRSGAGLYRQWMLGRRGQTMIAETGYIPVMDFSQNR
jgi:phosphate transport system substrate-binding protein